MSEHGSSAAQNPPVFAPQVLTKISGQCAFSHITQEHHGCRTFAGGTQNIGKTDITTAMLENIKTSPVFAGHVTNRDGSQQVTDKHCPKTQSAPP